MVTFIDEWRRKFPSCMVVKRLINRFVFETVKDRNRHLTFILPFFRCRSSLKNTGWVNIATMVQLSSFNWSREMYLSKPLCLQAFFAFLCATDWREPWSSACLENRRSRGFFPHSGIPVSNKQNVSDLLTRESLILWWVSVNEYPCICNCERSELSSNQASNSSCV